VEEVKVVSQLWYGKVWLQEQVSNAEQTSRQLRRVVARYVELAVAESLSRPNVHPIADTEAAIYSSSLRAGR
jgi:hypothetical protein